MTHGELVRALNSVGKAVFTEYFHSFKSYANGSLSLASCIGKLVDSGVSNDSGAKIRCGNAKKIFESKAECQALYEVINSKRISSDTINLAKKIYSEYRCVQSVQR